MVYQNLHKFLNHMNFLIIYDLNESKNVLYSQNKIFNLPYSIELTHNVDLKKLSSKIKIESFFLK